MHRPHDLAAELHGPAAVLRKLLDPAADPPAGLEHEDVRAGAGEVPRRGQSGQAGTEDEDVGQPASSLRIAARTRARAFFGSKRPR